MPWKGTDLRWRRRPTQWRTSWQADDPVERKDADGGAEAWWREDSDRSGAMESTAAAWSCWSTHEVESTVTE